MFGKLWQWIKRLIRRLLGQSPESPDSERLTPESARIRTDTECEALFLQLLEGVSQGWSRGSIQGYFIAKNIKEAELLPWFDGFGSQLLENPLDHEELARRLVRFSEETVSVPSFQTLSLRAGEVGREILSQIPQPEPLSPEDPEFWAEVIDAKFQQKGI